MVLKIDDGMMSGEYAMKGFVRFSWRLVDNPRYFKPWISLYRIKSYLLFIFQMAEWRKFTVYAGGFCPTFIGVRSCFDQVYIMCSCHLDYCQKIERRKPRKNVTTLQPRRRNEMGLFGDANERETVKRMRLLGFFNWKD